MAHKAENVYYMVLYKKVYADLWSRCMQMYYSFRILAPDRAFTYVYLVFIYSKTDCLMPISNIFWFIITEEKLE